MDGRRFDATPACANRARNRCGASRYLAVSSSVVRVERAHRLALNIGFRRCHTPRVVAMTG
jgi:hypothetical protein